jgi:proline-specific peptidase
MLIWRVSPPSIAGRRIWTTRVGDGRKAPVVCVAGGPGMPHDYIAPLAAIAGSGRPVVFYDPLGSGRSERPPGVAWSAEVYLDELEVVVGGLGVERYHLLAHSVGGIAVLPFAFRRPPGLVGLILASAPASIPAYQASVRRLLDLGPDELAAFERMDRLAAPRDASYVRVYQRFVTQHMCRARPTPPKLIQGIQQLNPAAHEAMKGGALFYRSALAGWDVSARLREIAVPTLITCGRHDVLPPELCAGMQQRIAGAALEVFEHSSHMAHFEEPYRYVERLCHFLDACDA